MQTSALYTIASAGAVSLLAFVGLFAFRWVDSALRSRLSTLIAAAIGVLIGEALFHLIPEALRTTHNPRWVGNFVLLGILGSLVIELSCRKVKRDSEIAPVGILSLISETIHNAVDGGILAGAYMAGPHIGLTATVAVACHEIPHELGNFAVLVHAGYERKRALMLNFYSACASLGGAALVLVWGSAVKDASAWILPVAAGSFLYVAIADLLPDLLRNHDVHHRLVNCCAATLGVSFMVLLTRSS